MRLAVIVTTIAVVTTATATATAERSREETSGRISYVEPRLRLKPQLRGDWFELASPTPVKYGTEFIVVDERVGRISRLRIDAYTGTVILRRLRVFYRDGEVETVPFARTLDRDHRSTVVDLHVGKAIDQIAITTEPFTRGTYTVYGYSGDRGIAAR